MLTLTKRAAKQRILQLRDWYSWYRLRAKLKRAGFYLGPNETIRPRRGRG